MKRIIVLGGGFGGVYTAMNLEKLLNKKNPDYEIIIINRENYFVFQPMLSEVVGGSLDVKDTINPLRRLLPKSKLYIREVDSIDIENKKVILAPKYSHKKQVLSYDHIVLSLGNVTDFRGLAGLHEHALPFKNLADSLTIRNQIIDVIEAASCEEDIELKKKLLTFVIGGGGWSGTEVAAELNDFVRNFAKGYKDIDPSLIRVVLVHSKSRLLDRELSESLGNYAGALLQKRGVEIMFNTHLTSATPVEALLDNGQRISSKTIISTVPSSPNPLIESLPLKLQKGKVVTDATLQAEGQECVWSLGDCSSTPNLVEGGFCPPTAQFATRQAKVLAYNIVATIRGKKKKEFRFKALGMLGALGHHSAVAEIFGRFKFSGLFAWFLWRGIYWVKLPGLDRKLKVALSWLLDMILPLDAVQLKAAPTQAIAHLHYEEGEIIFHEGDVGDYLYIIIDGEVEIYSTSEGKKKTIAKLGEGEYFGEMALLNEKARTATVKCISSANIIGLKKSDFGVLISNFQDLRKNIEQTEKHRKKQFSK